ncbi:MAG: single-stranded-DNA-specific exonuclease RecJ [Patescibacteria group bacterium]|mgnify:CR=1 FL=1
MKEWRIRDNPPKNYLKNLDEPELTKRLLFFRGIKTKKQAEEFLNPDYQSLGDPLEILNMSRAVRRILRAIKNKEKILVFGDYDADGVSASVIFHDFFRKIGFENFSVYIPDRHQEGYGLTFEVIERFIADKIDLVITVDCGITDFKEIAKAKKAGLEVIVIDHHLIPEKVPPAFAILDLHQKKEKYPFKYFSGAGLAFKVVSALIKKGDFNFNPEWIKWLLDAAALATIADMVPLLNENRVLVYFGLKVLQKTRRVGLKRLYKTLKLENSGVSEDDVGFLLAPRINIAGRMGDARMSFDLLTTDSENEADRLVNHLEEKNNERKILAEEILNSASRIIDKAGQLPEMIVVGNNVWSPGILGFACNKILDKYSRTVFLWGKGESKFRKGSVRGNGEVNVVKLMEKIPSGIFLEFGGHSMAAGFTLKEETKTEDFEKEIQAAFKKTKKEKVELEVLRFDKELSLDEANQDLISLLEKFRPFGMDNPKPVFLFGNIEVFEAKSFGNGGIHLELKFRKDNGQLISAIGFFMKNSLGRSPTGEAFEPKIEKGLRIDLAASVEKSNFKGYDEIRLRIVDLRLRQ